MSTYRDILGHLFQCVPNHRIGIFWYIYTKNSNEYYGILWSFAYIFEQFGTFVPKCQIVPIHRMYIYIYNMYIYTTYVYIYRYK